MKVSQSEIKRSYRKLAKEYHPDVNKTKEAEEKFKQINEAYEILGDEQKRKNYDMNNSMNFGSFGGFNSSNISDLFQQSFGGFQDIPKRKKSNHKKTFQDESNIEIYITVEESIFGVDKKTIPNSYKCECNKCFGHGGTFSDCNVCNGTGRVNKNDGFISINVTCTECMGTGQKKTGSCIKCYDKGYLLVAEELDIRIPEGIEERTKLLVRGKGNKINGKRGDLFISVKVIENEEYSRKNNNIYQRAKISAIDILLEKIIQIPSLRENFEIDLKKIENEKTFIFKNKGTKTVNGNSYGDLIIIPDVYYPKLDEKQKEILNSIFV